MQFTLLVTVLSNNKQVNFADIFLAAYAHERTVPSCRPHEHQLSNQLSCSFTTDTEPAYENGELVLGGSDLSLKGSLPYYAVEVIYSLGLLQVLTALLSDKFWWLLLAVSMYKASIECSPNTECINDI